MRGEGNRRMMRWMVQRDGERTGCGEEDVGWSMTKLGWRRRRKAGRRQQAASRHTASGGGRSDEEKGGGICKRERRRVRDYIWWWAWWWWRGGTEGEREEQRRRGCCQCERARPLIRADLVLAERSIGVTVASRNRLSGLEDSRAGQHYGHSNFARRLLTSTVARCGELARPRLAFVRTASRKRPPRSRSSSSRSRG